MLRTFLFQWLLQPFRWSVNCSFFMLLAIIVIDYYFLLNCDNFHVLNHHFMSTCNHLCLCGTIFIWLVSCKVFLRQLLYTSFWFVVNFVIWLRLIDYFTMDKRYGNIPTFCISNCLSKFQNSIIWKLPPINLLYKILRSFYF